MFDEARSIIDLANEKMDFGDLKLSLDYYKKHRDYDLSRLPGLNSLDYKVNFKEIRQLMTLPDKNALLQLLVWYCKAERFESFFALIDLFMPNVKDDARVVELIGECLKMDSEGTYVKRYLSDFPVLWLDKEIAGKFLSFNENNEVENNRILHLINQCKKSRDHADPNELENSVINGNYQLLDVLKGNDGIVISMGYSPEEADKIKYFDTDAIKYGDKTAFERLILLEGNRNGVAESIAAYDFLKNPLMVGTMLFPILLNDGNGELIYELYNYSENIRKKLASLKPIYLKALLLIGEKEEYWNHIKDNWLTLRLDKEMLLVGSSLAFEHGQNEIADVMNMRAEYSALNDFEIALIDGNVPKVRSLATDADYLLKAGYTSDEIKLIQESIRQKIDFSASDYNTIANRLFSEK